MEITTDALPWDDNDIIAWQNFLNTQTGRRLIPKVLEGIPELHGAGDTNAILVRSGEVRGFQDAARQFLSLTAKPKEISSDPATSYPSLVDDSKWNDKEKIQP